MNPVPPVEPSSRAQAEGSLPFEGLMVRVPHHDPEHGRRVRAVSLPFESLMVRVPHHDPEHGGSIFLTTLSQSMGRRVRALSLPFEGLRAMSLSNWSNGQIERQKAPRVGAG